jgi:hypothetical protein
MAIPTNVYGLHEIVMSGSASKHLLLTRVGRPGFCNANQPEEDSASALVEREEARLIRAFVVEHLAHHGPFAVGKIGELQSEPVGELLSVPGFAGTVDLWIAQTAYGAPWAVFGTAPSERAFWQAVEGDEYLCSLRPMRPAHCVNVYCLC